jgi:hypothetical protein
MIGWTGVESEYPLGTPGLANDISLIEVRNG